MSYAPTASLPTASIGLLSGPIIYTVTDDVGGVTGVIGPGGSTDDVTPTFVGLAAPLSTVRLGRMAFVGGSDSDSFVELAAGAADAAGAWSLTPTSPVPFSEHDFVVQQEVDGLVTPTPRYTITIGGAAPTITHAVDDEGAETGNLPSGSTTDDLTPRLVGTGSPGALLTLRRATSTVVGTTTVAADGSWSILAPLPNGTHSLTARQASGGVESADSAVFTLTISRTGSGAQPGPNTGAQRLAPGELLAFRPITIGYEGTPGIEGVITYILADEEAVSDWTPGTYASGAQVVRLGKVWESLKTGNTDTPGEGALTWIQVRPVSGAGVFDGSPGTVTRAAAGRVQLELRVEAYADTVCLLGARGHSVQMAVYRPSLAAFVFDSGPTALWMRRDPEGQLMPDSHRWYPLDIRPADIVIVVVASVGEPAELADLAIGMAMPLGEPLRPSDVGQRDFSRREFSQAGALLLTRRRFARDIAPRCLLPFTDGLADATLAWLEERRATVLCFSFTPEYRRFSLLGVHDSPRLSYDQPTHALLTFRVDGAT